MQSIKLAVAFLFRRAAEEEVAEEALARQASLDLHWFSPKDARRFLDAARALGYLKPGLHAGKVAPGFDLGSVEVPLDFRIDARALAAAPTAAATSVTEALVEAAARASSRPIDAVWAEVKAKQDAKLLEAPVAAALVAAASGVSLKEYFPQIREELAALLRASVTPSSS